MLKQVKNATMAVAAVVLLTSCFAAVKSPVGGFIYTDVQAPFAVTDATGSSKVGTSEAKSILGLFGSGDASIQTAAKQAGITKIHHVDEHVTNILGIIATYKVVVYGE